MTSDLFKKFPSLTNIEHEKDIRWWLDNFPTLKNEKFIVREKLDGANVQILFMPDGSRKVGRRTDWLKENEKFYNVHDAIDKSAALINALASHATEINRPVRGYFELYGPGINRRVNYGNDGLKLSILDMSIFFDEDRLVSQYELSEFLNRKVGHCSDMAPLLFFGKFEEAIKFNCDFNSRIMYMTDNQAEGTVIQPLNNVYFNARGERFIIKKKNAKFNERAKIKTTKFTEATESQKLFASYVNENRILSVFSKHGTINSVKQLGDYIKLVIEDAKEDFIKENPHVDTYNREVFSLGGKVTVPLLRKYL